MSDKWVLNVPTIEMLERDKAWLETIRFMNLIRDLSQGPYPPEPLPEPVEDPPSGMPEDDGDAWMDIDIVIEGEDEDGDGDADG